MAQRSGVDPHLPGLELVHGVGLVHVGHPFVGLTHAADRRRHDFAEAGVEEAVAQLQALVRVGRPAELQQRRFVVGVGVQDFIARMVQLGNGLAGHAGTAAGQVLVVVAVGAVAAGEVVALAAPCVGCDKLPVFAALGEGDAAVPVARVAQAVAVVAATRDLLEGAGAVDAVVGHAAAHTQSPGLAVIEYVLGLQRFHVDHATDRAGGIGGQARSLLDADRADQVRVQVAALLHAGIAAVHVDGLLAAVDDHRHPVLALQAADVDVQRAAVANVSGVHAHRTGQHIADRLAAEAFQLLVVQMHARAAVAVDGVGIGQPPRRSAFAGLAGHTQRADLAYAGVGGRGGLQHHAAGITLERKAGAGEQLCQRGLGVERGLHATAVPAAGQARIGSDGQAGLLTERGQGLVKRTGRDLPANGGGSILCVGGGRQQARRGQGQAQRDGKRARGRAGSFHGGGDIRNGFP